MLTARLLTGVVLFGGGGLSSGAVLSDCQGVELSRECCLRSAVVLSRGGNSAGGWCCPEMVLSRGWYCLGGAVQGDGAVRDGVVLSLGGEAVHNRK